MADPSITLYDQAFYAAQAEASLESARHVLPELFRYYRPDSVIDVGCGVGPWLRTALELGVPRGLGVDGDYVRREQLLISPDQFCPADLSQPDLFTTISSKTDGRFGLVISLEVAEHLPFDRSESFVDDLTRLGDVVLFSAAVPYQYGTGHINEQWPEFWALLFRNRGFKCFDILRQPMWSCPQVDWWYAQNALVFVREESAVYDRFPVNAMDGPLAKIHPAAWLSAILNHWRPHRASARGLEEADLATIAERWITGGTDLPRLKTVEHGRASLFSAADAFPNNRLLIDDPEAKIAQQDDSLANRKNELDEVRGALFSLRSNVVELLPIDDGTQPPQPEKMTDGNLILRLRREYQSQQEALKRVRQQLSNERDELEKTRAQVAHKEAESARLTAANATLRSQVSRHVSELAQLPGLRNQICTGQDRIVALETRLSTLRVELDATNAAVRTLKDAYASAQLEIRSLLHSTSWRMTRPLRAVRRLFPT
ncbi:methyltransferase domain-containing protein [Gluconacetobacter tumulisoli]|uniref:Methyltransferase domain-containing protein n=1 Tax=Gluconacetobacter tumulisoli TaxID=1286189 RepID=A0A7W4KA81_9PROT|nr:methyltransferase domain-containing protein [Gluconacetobacter tumulisoli]MBB2203208.1 hypothetical protein [Gluconacetobacter tumulisoli]